MRARLSILLTRVSAAACVATGIAGTVAHAEPQAAIVAIPGPPKPIMGLPGGVPDYPPLRPALPRGTPEEQVEQDPAKPLTNLVSALDRAYWTSPQLLAERARARSQDYRIPQARGAYGPQLDYSASYGYQRDNYEQPVGGFVARAGWTTAASAVLRQPLFTFGRLRAGEDNAKASVSYAQASLRAAEQQAMFNAISAYATLIRDRTGVRIAADNVDLLTHQSADTDTRLAAHESTATDSQQVSSRLDLARAQLLIAQATAGSSEAAFLRFIGSPAGELADPNPLTMPVRTIEDAYVFAADHNPVVAAAYARERVSRAQLDAARAELLPRIDLAGQASYGTSTPYTTGLHQTELRGSITLTGTIDSGVRQARIGEAESANDADWRLIDSSLRENRAEVADAWNEWQAQDASIARLASAVASARSAFEGALLQERAGMRTTLDILELARDLLQVRSSYNTATAASYVAQARLLAAIGALGHGDLLPGTRAYDPGSHLMKTYWQSDVPLLTPLVRALDGVTRGKRGLRPVRDPAAPVAIGGAALTP